MEYKKYDYNDYTVHLLKTNKFKSIFLSLVLINDFDKDSLTKSFILRKLLTTSSKNLKNEVEVSKKVSDLYNSGIVISNDMCNNVISTNFDMEVLEDKYTEEGLFERALEYFFDTIFNPNIVDDKFEKNNYELCLKSVKNYYKTEKENKVRYAFDRAYLLMDEEKFKYRINGYEEDLKNITRENMVSYYKKIMENANVNIFIIGEFDDKNILNLLEKNINNKFSKNDNKYEINIFNEKPEIKRLEETEHNNQSILIMIYKILNITERQRNVILPVFNRIFGLGNNCKLFKNIREENSLCYDIRSAVSRNSILTIQAGISYENKDKVVKLIEKQLDEMKKGNITEEEFNEAILFRRRNLKQFDDYIDSLLYIKESSILYGNDDLEKRREELETVKIDEIVELANNIELNVEYILKGDKDNGKD